MTARWQPPLTRAEREHLRQRIDEARRVRLARAPDPERLVYWKRYYRANRARILERKKAAA